MLQTYYYADKKKFLTRNGKRNGIKRVTRPLTVPPIEPNKTIITYCNNIPIFCKRAVPCRSNQPITAVVYQREYFTKNRYHAEIVKYL